MTNIADPVRITPKPRILVLMQGAPGSGKSTVARALHEQYKTDSGLGLIPPSIFSTDDYWTQAGDGKYHYDGAKIGLAHIWNQNHVLAAMTLNYELVIVDNTNIKYTHAKPYFDLAAQFGYEVEVIRVDPGLDTCILRNADRPEDRRVPLDTVIRMYQSMEDLWQHRRLTHDHPPAVRTLITKVAVA